MDIGDKLKNARAQAGRTQEQAAEALGVSRQTVSNWENGKTYPDIVHVIQMSDLYGVSLDLLLKGEGTGSGYLGHLAESADTVRSKNRLAGVVLLAVYLGIWAGSLLVFWLFTDGSDAMAYSLMVLWILLPVATFVVALLLEKLRCGGRLRWLFAPGLGLLYMLAEYATFRAANMAANRWFLLPDLSMMAAGTAIALLGAALGALFRRRSDRKSSR